MRAGLSLVGGRGCQFEKLTLDEFEVAMDVDADMVGCRWLV